EELLFVVAKHVYEQYSFNQILDMFPFIKFQTEGSFQEIINNFINQYNFSPKKTIEFGSEEAMKRAVVNGAGYGILSSNMIEKGVELVDLTPIRFPEKKVTFKTSLIYLEKKEENAVIKSFSKLVKSQWKMAYEQV